MKTKKPHRIEVSIECHSRESANIPEDLRDTIQTQCEWRRGKIFVEHIVGYYPFVKDDGDSGTLIEFRSGECMRLRESIDEIDALIDEILE
jgi:hypothetical protein